MCPHTDCSRGCDRGVPAGATRLDSALPGGGLLARDLLRRARLCTQREQVSIVAIFLIMQ